MPNSLSEWEADWQQILNEQNEARQRWQESGQRAGVSEQEIQAFLAELDESDQMYRSMFKTAWMLWAVGHKLTTPRWRKKRRLEYQAIIDRLYSPVKSFNERVTP